MEEEEEHSHSNLDFSATTKPSRSPPPCVCFPPFSPPTFSLSTRLSSQNRVIRVKTGRKLAWLSLQGRIVGAEESTSLRTLGSGGLGWKEALAWETLEPMQRILIVAVVASAVASDESKRAREVERLKRSVEIRDELLLRMQKKLDDLCEHIYPVKDQSMISFYNSDDKHISEECVNWKGSEYHTNNSYAFGMPSQTTLDSFDVNLSNMQKDALEAKPGRHEILKSSQLTNIEQEERRMSDLSDLFSSAVSSVDIQMSILAEQQEYYNLRKECEEKDATINELNAAILAYSVAECSRISELEDIIKRKNLVITKLKKDLVFLEQKVIQLTRLRRPSSSTAQSNLNRMQLPLMLNNILYDMSSSSPSSSDSDSPDNGKGDTLQEDDDAVSAQGLVGLTSNCGSSLHSFSRSTERSSKQQTSSLPKENRDTNMTSIATVLKEKASSSSGVNNKSKRRGYQEPKRQVSLKRWM